MTLHLDDWIIWDLWLAPRQAPADLFHCFFLHAPRSISDPELRHNLATVGHSVSSDLHSWQYLGTALEPGPAGAWDDFTIWTGGIVAQENRWYMLYTRPEPCRGGPGSTYRSGHIRRPCELDAVP